MPLSIALFLEDDGHSAIIGAIVERVVRAAFPDAQFKYLNANGGLPRAMKALKRFMHDLNNGKIPRPDLAVIAIDGNCKGYVAVRKQIEDAIAGSLPAQAIAVPDPHVERWLLLDSAAFKIAVGHGCDAPDQKCEKDRYKRLLAEAVRNAGLAPILNGLEHAKDIIAEVDLEKVAGDDPSFGHFMRDLRSFIATHTI